MADNTMGVHCAVDFVIFTSTALSIFLQLGVIEGKAKQQGAGPQMKGIPRADPFDQDVEVPFVKCAQCDHGFSGVVHPLRRAQG